MSKKRETFPVYVVALNTNEEFEHNILASYGIPKQCYKQVFGCYKGETEKSYIVSDQYAKEVRQIAKDYKQESILYLDEDRKASLVFTGTGKTQPLGKLKNLGRVKQVNVKGLDAYTIDPVTDCVYSVEAK